MGVISSCLIAWTLSGALRGELGVLMTGDVCSFVGPEETSGLVGGELRIGKERPRSFPRLATPTPQVKVVRYPEQSLPISRH